MSESIQALEAPNPHPIHLVVNDDLERSRLTVFFRLILAIPLFLWLTIWSIAVSFVVIVAWIIGLVAGRVPDSLHSFMAAYVRFSTHVFAHLGIVAGRRSQHDAVEAGVAQSIGEALDAAHAFRRPHLFDDQVVSGPPAGAHRAHLHLADIVIGAHLHEDHADQIAASAGQRARGDIGAIAHGLDQVLDSRPGLGPDALLAIDHP